MEALILIPVAFIIYGWMKSFPAPPAQPAGVNGCNGFCDDYVPGDDDLFNSDDDTNDLFFGTGGINTVGFLEEDSIIPTDDLVNDLMFNPSFEWCSMNIYHHEDLFADDSNNSMSEPFSINIDDGFSIGMGEI